MYSSKTDLRGRGSAAGSMKLAAIIERAHAEARKIADMAIAEISCPTRARDVNSSATEAVPPPPGGTPLIWLFRELCSRTCYGSSVENVLVKKMAKTFSNLCS